MHFVYIIRSESDGTFYTGMTSDLQRRLLEHNRSQTKSTRSRRPWKLVYSEEHATLAEARNKEKFWKSGAGRKERDARLKK